MPPRTRKPAVKPAEPAEAPPARHAKGDGDICGQCWPHGWRTENVKSASCIHGTWAR